ncbi:MAG: hypothetical protein NWF07_00160, partial [Candidatus Bathyarchaeota archaeon]|nr:hypothetical protein [Candidatus Bathyarchaeota archaeon]
MTGNKSLIDILHKKSTESQLTHDLLKIRQKTTPYLNKISETFPEYTIHDVSHSEKIITILEWILGVNLVEALNEFELFFLLASAYLHDIGMADIDEIQNEEIASISDPVLKQEYIRTFHHIRSERFITENYESIGIDNIHIARIIGRICRGHRDDLSDRKKYDYKTIFGSQNYSINVPLLTSLLRLADELDLTYERTPYQIYTSFSPKDPVSLEEWTRHLTTCGVGLDPDNSSRILIFSECDNPSIHRSLKKLEVKIQSLLDEMSDYLFNYNQYVDELPQRIIVKINTHGYSAIDLRFRLQEEEITTLLLGERLYDRPEATIRELIQNSYDACRV